MKIPEHIDEAIMFMLRVGESYLDSLTRECGECVLCCVAPSIKDQPDMEDKPAATPCKHCTAKGCGIYEKRPYLCRNYECLYRLGLIDHRPDTDGVAWTFQAHACPDGVVLLMGHTVNVHKAIEKPSVVATLRRFLDESDLVTCAVLRDRSHAISWLNTEDDGQIVNIDRDDRIMIESERGYPPIPNYESEDTTDS